MTSESSAGDFATVLREAPAKVVLRGVHGVHFGRVIPVRHKLLIGRDLGCDLILDFPRISRQHAVVEVTGTQIRMRDLGSGNGTFVNDVRVRDVELKPGDQIRFDQYRFVLEIPGLMRAAASSVGRQQSDDAGLPAWAWWLLGGIGGAVVIFTLVQGLAS